MGGQYIPHSLVCASIKLEEIVNKVAKAKRLDGPQLMHGITFLPSYADEVTLFSYNLDDMQVLLKNQRT